MSTDVPPATHKHYVDLPYLVITSHTALPKRCVVTNEPLTDSEYQVWDLPSIPRWARVLAFTSPFLLIAAPFFPLRCKVKAGLARRVRRKNLFIKSVLYLLILMPVFCMIAALILRRSELFLAAIGASLLPYVALPTLVLLTPPLRVHRRKDDLFWIKGCSRDFLESLRDEMS